MPWFFLFVAGPTLMSAIAALWGLFFMTIVLHAIARAFHASVGTTYIAIGGAVVIYYARQVVIDAVRISKGLTPQGAGRVYEENLRKAMLAALCFWVAFVADGMGASAIRWLNPRAHSHVEIVFPQPNAAPAGHEHP